MTGLSVLAIGAKIAPLPALRVRCRRELLPMCQGVAMRFIVYGAGAVGGVVGALLAEARDEVVLIARGPHAETIRRSGSARGISDRSRLIPNGRHGGSGLGCHPGGRRGPVGNEVPGHSAPRSTPSGMPRPPSTPVVCLQNGVDNERAALRLFPNVYGVCVMCPPVPSRARRRPGFVVIPSRVCSTSAVTRGDRRDQRAYSGGFSAGLVRIGREAGHHALEVPQAAHEFGQCS